MSELLYAGIGSRKTPADVYNTMMEIGEYLARQGWILRSGHADGADRAFEIGCIHGQGKKEIYLPWDKFNGACVNNIDFIVPNFRDPKYYNLASQFHQAWHHCKPGAMKLHARNGCQILGRDLLTPATMVVCWTSEGLGGGGTGQALRIAKHYGIPIFDLALPNTLELLGQFVDRKMGVDHAA